MLKFQAIQTSADELTIRLESKCVEESDDVWARVYANACDYLACQGLDNVRVVLAPEPPRRDPKNGRFRKVWIEKVNP